MRFEVYLGEQVVRQGDDADGMYFVEVSLVGFHLFCVFSSSMTIIYLGWYFACSSEVGGGGGGENSE